MPTIYTGILRIDGTAHEIEYSAPNSHPHRDLIEDALRTGNPGDIANCVIKKARKVLRPALNKATTISLEVTKHTTP